MIKVQDAGCGWRAGLEAQNNGKERGRERERERKSEKERNVFPWSQKNKGLAVDMFRFCWSTTRSSLKPTYH